MLTIDCVVMLVHEGKTVRLFSKVIEVEVFPASFTVITVELRNAKTGDTSLRSLQSVGDQYDRKGSGHPRFAFRPSHCSSELHFAPGKFENMLIGEFESDPTWKRAI